MKSLVAYYSRTNTTKKLAEDIAKSLGADIEEITTEEKYDGKIGYARAGKHALSEKIVEISDSEYEWLFYQHSMHTRAQLLQPWDGSGWSR